MLSPGEIIDGKYRVVRRLGEGAMGAVFEALSIRLNRRVAIKVMHAAVAREKKLVLRFEREAQAAANIGSIHVVDIFDLGDLPSGDRYMVMEFLDGESLQARLERSSRLAPQMIAEIVIQLLDGLAKVHQAGIVHRDLKPANIFLARGEEGADLVKILDFGVCKMSEKGGSGERDFSTGVGAVLGSLAYMSPEQVEHGSKDLDGRADLYAVGVILYRSVTGALPYGASTLIDLLRQLREGRAPRVEALAGNVDKRFADIVSKSLEWDRTARFATAKELQRALADWVKSVARIQEALSDFLEAPAETERAAAALGKVTLVTGPRASAMPGPMPPRSSALPGPMPGPRPARSSAMPGPTLGPTSGPMPGPTLDAAAGSTSIPRSSRDTVRTSESEPPPTAESPPTKMSRRRTVKMASAPKKPGEAPNAESDDQEIEVEIDVELDENDPDGPTKKSR